MRENWLVFISHFYVLRLPCLSLSWSCVLILGPLLNLVISSCNELISQIQQNCLSTFLNYLASDALHRISFDINRLNCFVRTKPMRQIVAVIIDHSKCSKLCKVEWKSYRDLLNAVVTNVEYFKAGKFWTAKFFNISQFVNVQV